MALLNAIGRSWCRRAGRWCALSLVFAVVAAGPAAAADGPASREYQIKAVFLFNFAQFAEWPSRAFADPKAPITIAILGHDPFGTYLDELVRGETVGGRPILIRRLRDVREVEGCHILFVSRSESPQLPGIIKHLKRQSILTISDADAFTRAGGMVRFVMVDGKVRLRINVDAARACGLTISSKILRPATIVGPGSD